MKKEEIKRLITIYLIDEELVLKEDAEEQLPANIDSSTLELSFRKKRNQGKLN